MAQAVRLSDPLVKEAKAHALVSMRSVPKEIEYYYRLGKIAEDNPDLPMSFIKETLCAKAELEAGEVTVFSFSE